MQQVATLMPAEARIESCSSTARAVRVAARRFELRCRPPGRRRCLMFMEMAYLQVHDAYRAYSSVTTPQPLAPGAPQWCVGGAESMRSSAV